MYFLKLCINQNIKFTIFGHSLHHIYCCHIARYYFVNAIRPCRQQCPLQAISSAPDLHRLECLSGPARGSGGGAALRQNIFKITASEKHCCKPYLNANKMKLQGKNETIINIVEIS